MSLKSTDSAQSDTLVYLPGNWLEALERRQLLSAETSALANLTLLPMASGGASAQGFTPAQIRQAYGFNQVTFSGSSATANGAGQTIAIVDAYNDPKIKSDLATFDSQFDLAAPPSFSVVSQTGSTTSLPASNADADLEISLDVEWAHAIAPGANILLVEANSDSITSLMTAVNYARKQSGVATISMSWGSDEFSGETAYNSDFTTPSGHSGETFVVASGDSGASQGADWPAVVPSVLSVGGTTLNLTSSGAYSSETAWADSTGGASEFETEPTFQYGVNGTGKRDTPDVAYDANPNTGFAVYDSVSDEGSVGWQEIGGTSAGAPQWAALVAIADQGRKIAGKSALDGASGTLPILYTLAGTSSTYAANFHDVTAGSTFGRGFSTNAATTGYDLVTGLGSPDASAVVSSLIGGKVSLPATPIKSAPASGSSGSTGQSPFRHGGFGRFGGFGFYDQVLTATQPTPAPTVSISHATIANAAGSLAIVDGSTSSTGLGHGAAITNDSTATASPAPHLTVSEDRVTAADPAPVAAAHPSVQITAVRDEVVVGKWMSQTAATLMADARAMAAGASQLFESHRGSAGLMATVRPANPFSRTSLALAVAGTAAVATYLVASRRRSRKWQQIIAD